MRGLAKAMSFTKGRGLKERRKTEGQQKSRGTKPPQHRQTPAREPAEAARRFVLSHPHNHLVFQSKGRQRAAKTASTT
jgi:hypothetical protein